jgi:hypothetical protein
MTRVWVTSAVGEKGLGVRGFLGGTGVSIEVTKKKTGSGGVWAKCHVRVSKQSCKQANRLILWGVRSTTKKKLSIFFYFVSPKKLEKYDFTRPKVSKYSLTS